MASKSTADRSPPAASIPATISPNDKVLAYRIALPSNPCVVYALYRPSLILDTSLSAYDSIELARRTVSSHNTNTTSLVDSILLSVQSGKDPLLYLFLVTRQETINTALEHLVRFSFDNLTLTEHSFFAIQGLARLPAEVDAFHRFSHFLDAVRLQTIIAITEASNRSDQFLLRGQVKRFKDGFVLSRTPPPLDWASGWDYKALERPITYFHLQVQISYTANSPSHLIIQATPLSTPYCSLPPSPPLLPGSPIVLLPYGTPAYFLTSYEGPSNALSNQFRESLQGLGVGDWESSYQQYRTNVSLAATPEQMPRFILGWIRVENKQGEDKGTVFIWPTQLCLSYLPSQQNRPSLDYIPELPSPLQASPHVPACAPDVLASERENSVQNSLASQTQLYAPRGSVSPLHFDSLNAFRNLTVSKSRDIYQVAREVGSYVDAVARERERERERLKREREVGSSPKLARTTPVTPGSTTIQTVQTYSPAIPNPSSTPSTQVSHHQHHTQTQPILQSFYPSPPQTTQISMPASDDKTLTVPESPFSRSYIASSDGASGLSIPTASKHQVAVNTAYDPFSNLANWTQSSDSYLNIEMDFGMDMDMGFSMNMDPSTPAAPAAYTTHRSTMDFDDAFTDDDFSFFDKPSKERNDRSSITTNMASVHRQISNPIATTVAKSLPSSIPPVNSSPFFDDMELSGPGPPLPSLSNPWTPSTFADAFTPRSIDVADSRPPELLPSSPGPSPETHSAPQTPGVQLNFNLPGARTNDYASALFEPIPFSSSHRAADGKYLSGKFALPSPATEVEYGAKVPTSPISSDGGQTWRTRYNSRTDPRFGMVRKLIGVKRKLPDPHRGRDRASISSWIQSQEDWATPDMMDADMPSEVDSDDENHEESENESPGLSRPITPPPSYLPLGPSLLYCKFDHSQMLQVSTPLRPPGAATIPTNLGTSAPIPSVPTPVSPAATLGAATEKSRSLESAAFVIATEGVENCLWAEAWKTNNVTTKRPLDIWPDDIKAAARLLELVPFLDGPVDLATLFNLNNQNSDIQLLETPYISIGKGDAVVQILPTALRFWEKLGLGPKGGCKDLEVYALYEDKDRYNHTLVEEWLKTMAAAYKEKRMGRFTLGNNSTTKNGLVEIRFDTTARKSLASFISGINPSPLPVVVFLIVPVSVMTLASPILRQILSSSKKAIKGFTDSQIVFQLIPEPYILDVEQSPKSHGLLDIVCSSLYNRVQISVDRHISRRIHTSLASSRMPFQEPTFTLSRTVHNKVNYVRSAHPSLDVMDRFTLLHVGYQVSPCRKWLLASCVDQRGESYDLGLWLMQSPGDNDGETEVTDEAYAIQKVWDFATRFAKKANIEWRMVITKLGLMTNQEVKAWTSQIERAPGPTTAIHVFLVSAELNAPWTILNPKPNKSTPSRMPRSSSSAAKHNIVFSEVSAAVYALGPSNRLTASVPPSDSTFRLSFVPEPPADSQIVDTVNRSADTCQDQVGPHPIPFIPLSSTTLIWVPRHHPTETSIRMLHIHLIQSFHLPRSLPYVPDNVSLQSDIIRNFYELSILSASRFHMTANPILPFHLAAIDAMWHCLDCDWDRPDGPTDP